MALRQNAGRSGGWQVIYTGFVLIVLCFFILLTSFTSLDASKITRFADAFYNAVNVFSGGKSIEKSTVVLDSEVNLLPKQDPLGQLFEQVQRIILEEELDQIQLHRTDEGVVLSLSDTLLFDSARADLAADAYPLLGKMARLIDRLAVPLEIRGHADDRLIRTAAFPSNWELSTSRAVAVLRFLIEHEGIDPQHVTAVGFAHYHPLVKNDSPAHRAMNRRVEFVFMAE